MKLSFFPSVFAARFLLVFENKKVTRAAVTSCCCYWWRLVPSERQSRGRRAAGSERGKTKTGVSRSRLRGSRALRPSVLSSSRFAAALLSPRSLTKIDDRRPRGLHVLSPTVHSESQSRRWKREGATGRFDLVVAVNSSSSSSSSRPVFRRRFFFRLIVLPHLRGGSGGRCDLALRFRSSRLSSGRGRGAGRPHRRGERHVLSSFFSSRGSERARGKK